MPDALSLAARTHVEHNLGYAEALGGRVTRAGDVVAVDIGGPAPFLNAAVPVRPAGAAVVAEVAGRWYGAAPHAVVDYFATLDLTPYGYVRTGTMPVMVRTPQPLVAGGALDVVRVTDADGLAAFERVMVDGMGITAYAGAPAHSLWNVPALDRPTLRFHLGSLDGEPVACALAVVLGDCVGIFAVATLPDHRRRGFGAALTAAAIADAPPVPAVLTASPMGAGVYRKLGFVTVADRVGWRTE